MYGPGAAEGEHNFRRGKPRGFRNMKQLSVSSATAFDASLRPRLLFPHVFPFFLHPPSPTEKKQSIAPTAEEVEELDACDAWVAALVDAEIADEQQEAFYLEQQESENASLALSSAVAAVSVH